MQDLQTAISGIKRSPKEIEQLRAVAKKMPASYCETFGKTEKRCDLCATANYCFENMCDNMLHYQAITPQTGVPSHPKSRYKGDKSIKPGGSVICFGDRR